MRYHRLYYYLKPVLSRRVQLLIRGSVVRHTRARYHDVWPIDPATARPPEAWRGWPAGKQFALVLTHDIESEDGQEKSYRLADLEMGLGFRSSFNFVAEKYPVRPELREHLNLHGFEVGIHGLTHDRKLYSTHEIFLEQAQRINRYLGEWKAVGFRSPCMYHNLDWMHALDIEYDASTFDTDPFEPQPDGVGTIFPFQVRSVDGGKGYVELPYTLPQDFTLFALMKERDIDVWKRKLDWVAAHGGMALLNTHPDYMDFGDRARGCDQYDANLYREFLMYIRHRYDGAYWHALPREVARFLGPSCADRSEASSAGTPVGVEKAARLEPASRHKTAVATYFSSVAEPWEEIYDTPDDNFRFFSNYAVVKRKDMVLEHLDRFARGQVLKVLDAGCGAGIVLEALSRRGHKVAGVDISESMVAKANQRLAGASPEPPCRQGDIENLPFPDASFDAVLALGVIMYLPEDHRALQEMYRVLRPGGRLFLVVPNLTRLNLLFDPYYLVRSFDYLRKRWQWRRTGVIKEVLPHDFKTNRNFTNRRYTYQGLNRLLNKHGFTDPGLVGVDYGPPTFWRKEMLPLQGSVFLSENLARLADKKGFGWLKMLTGQWLVCAERP